MHAAEVDDERRRLRLVACQEAAAAACQRLLAVDADDPDVGAVMVVASMDGRVEVTFLSASGAEVGGYSL